MFYPCPNFGLAKFILPPDCVRSPPRFPNGYNKRLATHNPLLVPELRQALRRRGMEAES